MFYTYVLQSEKDDKFYVGFTKDLKLRPALFNSRSEECNVFNRGPEQEKAIKKP
ncbi:MAG: hypothetical protein SRB2_04055 [Desulfobacteraceae bacterium Eth-SRB2]|nr:MAG: hypothetical protein SRB2_04055 [Desulfobacteraceae bacterium Eth-SRB2]